MMACTPDRHVELNIVAGILYIVHGQVVRTLVNVSWPISPGVRTR